MTATTERVLKVAAPLAVGALLLVAWQLASELRTGRLPVVPAPGAVFDVMAAQIGLLFRAAVITGGNALVGLVGGTLVALVLAALAAWIRPIDLMTAPVVAAIAVIPIVALTPILNTMFGASSQVGRQIVAGIAAFIPVYVNVLRGLRQTRAVHRDLFRAYAATGPQRLTKLTLPTAIPYLTTGIRIASSVAVISALVAEYFGGPNDGLGTAIGNYARTNQPLAWAFVAASIAVGLVFFAATTLVERLTARRGTA